MTQCRGIHQGKRNLLVFKNNMIKKYEKFSSLWETTPSNSKSVITSVNQINPESVTRVIKYTQSLKKFWWSVSFSSNHETVSRKKYLEIYSQWEPRIYNCSLFSHWKIQKVLNQPSYRLWNDVALEMSKPGYFCFLHQTLFIKQYAAVLWLMLKFSNQHIHFYIKNHQNLSGVDFKH